MIKQDANEFFDQQDEFVPAGAGFSDSLFQIAWRNRWIILILTLATLIAGFLYIQKATPIFTSTSRVYVEQSGPKIISEAQGVMTQSKNYLYTQVELVKSTPIISLAMESAPIKRMRTFGQVDNVVGYLKKELDVSVGKKDDIISVSFDSPYPAESAEVINTVVDSYITYHSTRKKSTSAEVLKILQKEKTKRSKEVNEKLQALMEYKRQNEGLAYQKGGSNIILDRLASLSEAVTTAQLATIEAKSIYDTTQAMLSDPVSLKQLIEAQRARGVYIASEDEGSRIKNQIAALELQFDDLSQNLTDDHPKVVALKEKIDKLKYQLEGLDDKFASAQLSIAKQQYLAAQKQEEEVTSFFDEQRQQALELNEQMAQYTLLESDYIQTKKLSDILDDRIKELNITEDVGALNITILEVARPADKASKPQKPRIMAMALVIGLMLGGGLALLRDMLDHRLRSIEQIKEALGVIVLGTVPHMPKSKSLSERGLKVHLESDSPVAEAYRTIRTSIFFGVPQGKAKTLLITSPAAGDGKTTLASNLAISMAQAGQKTLLLDADFRRPMQHNVFKVSRDLGLSSVIAGSTGFADAVQSTEVENLYLLTAGPDVPNPSEILNSTAFNEFVQQMTKEYDRIILDSPPVMPVSDSRILAALCDITVLVLRADKSTRNVSRGACEGLAGVGAKLLGTVVNDVSKRNGSYGYYSGYGYKYKYGYGKKSSD